MIPENGNWRDRAACQNDWRDGSADFFYDTMPMSVEWAKDRCRGCPVIDRCLEYALDNNEPYGVWGGLTADERRALLRQRMRQRRSAAIQWGGGAAGGGFRRTA